MFSLELKKHLKLETLTFGFVVLRSTGFFDAARDLQNSK